MPTLMNVLSFAAGAIVASVALIGLALNRMRSIERDLSMVKTKLNITE